MQVLFIPETDIHRWQIHSQNQFTSIGTHSTISQTLQAEYLKTTKMPTMHFYRAIDECTVFYPKQTEISASLASLNEYTHHKQ